MAESVNSNLLSAVTEGQSKINSTVSSGGIQSSSSIPHTSKRNHRNSYQPTTSDSYEQISKKYKSNSPKRRSLGSLSQRQSSAQLLNTDCIANRTRSRASLRDLTIHTIIEHTAADSNLRPSRVSGSHNQQHQLQSNELTHKLITEPKAERLNNTANNLPKSRKSTTSSSAIREPQHSLNVNIPSKRSNSTTSVTNKRIRYNNSNKLSTENSKDIDSRSVSVQNSSSSTASAITVKEISSQSSVVKTSRSKSSKNKNLRRSTRVLNLTNATTGACVSGASNSSRMNNRVSGSATQSGQLSSSGAQTVNELNRTGAINKSVQSQLQQSVSVNSSTASTADYTLAGENNLERSGTSYPSTSSFISGIQQSHNQYIQHNRHQGSSNSVKHAEMANNEESKNGNNQASNSTGGSGSSFQSSHKSLSQLIFSSSSSHSQQSQQNLSNSNMPLHASTSNTASAAGPSHPDSESDDSEVGRLQALLEARGLPPHLFGPRVHHLLHRNINNGSTSKVHQLLTGLQAPDESQQLQAVIEMCQMLVMGNEDTLTGFPIKQVVPVLITLLRMEHNFDIMNNACRALAYMLEALPRSSSTVVDAVPVFLEKLQVIQCMDVAEQSLAALEILSRRHNKIILLAQGVSACLTFLEFFSINAQRHALAITANCCLNLHQEEFYLVRDSLSQLAKLLEQQDKKCVESVCSAFCRLIDSFQLDNEKLQVIASPELLKNCQQLLVITPSVLNSGTFTNVIRMLSVMCANAPDLAITLLKNDFSSTLLYLLTGNAEPVGLGEIELISRSPAELYEITCLIGELMPRLPSDGIFSVDSLMEKPKSSGQDNVQWQWRDDRGNWHSYSTIDSRMIEAAHLNSEDEVNLTTQSGSYSIDFHTMHQINEDTGTTRAVQRKVNINNPMTISENGNDMKTNSSTAVSDVRVAYLKEEEGLAAEFIKNLFSVLYEVYSSSAGPSVRYKCLRGLLKMVYFANSNALQEILKNQIFSSHIAGMLASDDLKIVVGALQMAEILIQKLPNVFSVHFKREGVLHQINMLANPTNPICETSPRATAINFSTNQGPTISNTSSINYQSVYDAASHSSKSHINQAHSLISEPNPHGLHSYAKSMSLNSMSGSLPSTSASASNHSMPSTSSTRVDNNATLRSMIMGTYNEYPTDVVGSSYQTGNYSIDMTTNSIQQNQSIHIQHQQQAVQNMPTSSQNASGSGQQQPVPAQRSSQSKISEMLKKKVPPKRKSTVSNSRSKNRQEEQPSVMHDLINKATLGSASNRNAPGTSSSSGSSTRSRFSSSILASLNPARWGRQSSANSSSSYTKENTTNNLSKSNSNSNFITAGNRELARQWIRDQSAIFANRFNNQLIPIEKVPSDACVLNRLSNVINNLHGNKEDCWIALNDLKNILLQSDITPFEFNHSCLIKAMTNFLTSDQGIVHRDDRLRAFLNVFANLPVDYGVPIDTMNIESTAFRAFVTKLNGCVTQLEQFPVKLHDFYTGTGNRSNTSALKFFNTHQLKCNIQRHPSCTNLKQWKNGTVRVDPLALIQAIERYLVMRGYGGIRAESDDDSDDDIDDSLTAAAVTQGIFKHKLQFLIGDHVLPYNMTVYQAVKQYSSLVQEQSETDTDSETPMGNASIWIQQHTIFYRPVEDDNSSSNTGKGTSSSRKNNKGSGTQTKSGRKKPEYWTCGLVPAVQSPLMSILTKTLPTDMVNIQDASLDALCMLRIMNGLNRHWNYLYNHVRHEPIINQSEFIHPKLTAKANRQVQDPVVIMTGNLPSWLQQIATVCPFLFPFETRHLLFYAVTFDRDRALQRLLDATPELNSSDSQDRVTPRLDRRKRSISRQDILQQAEQILMDFAHSKALLEIQYDNEVGTGLGPTLEFYAIVSNELQRTDLGLWYGGDSYQRTSNQIGEAIKSGVVSRIDDDDMVEDQQIEQVHNQTSTHTTMLTTTTTTTTTTMTSRTNVQIVERTDQDRNSSEISVIERQTQQIQEQVQITTSTIEYVNTPNGLFPMPIGRNAKCPQMTRSKIKFKFLGKLMAKAVMDSRMLDLPFSIPFYRWMLGEEHSLSLADLSWVAPEIASTLSRLQDVVHKRDQIKAKIEVMKSEEQFFKQQINELDLDGCPISDLGLDFVVPGYPDIELRRHGQNIPVTIHNLHLYISLVTFWLLNEGVQKQFEAFREGFDSVFPINRLRMFYPEELENVFCGATNTTFKPWDSRMLQECCRIDHGFTQDSKAIRYLFEILSSYNYNEQRMFLQFVTGSPRLPTGGFRALNPPLTIVRKTMECNQLADDYLPSVMTCVNYLKLPDYSSKEVMRAKLRIATSEGSSAFHLS